MVLLDLCASAGSVKMQGHVRPWYSYLNPSCQRWKGVSRVRHHGSDRKLFGLEQSYGKVFAGSTSTIFGRGNSPKECRTLIIEGSHPYSLSLIHI